MIKRQRGDLFVAPIKIKLLKLLTSVRFSLGKQPTFGDATTGFPAKWRLRNERRNSVLISSGSRRGAQGGQPPLFSDQTEVRRAEKFFWRPLLPCLRVWMTALPSYLKVWIRHCWWRFTTQIWVVPLIGWIKFPTRHDQSEALPRSGWWRVISMEFLRSFLRRHFAGKPVVASKSVGCFLRLC